MENLEEVRRRKTLNVSRKTQEYMQKLFVISLSDPDDKTLEKNIEKMLTEKDRLDPDLIESVL